MCVDMCIDMCIDICVDMTSRWTTCITTIAPTCALTHVHTPMGVHDAIGDACCCTRWTATSYWDVCMARTGGLCTALRCSCCCSSSTPSWFTLPRNATQCCAAPRHARTDVDGVRCGLLRSGPARPEDPPACALPGHRQHGAQAGTHHGTAASVRRGMGLGTDCLVPAMWLTYRWPIVLQRPAY